MIQRLGSGWMIVAAIFFAIMGALVKLGADRFGSVELVFYRTVFSVVVLASLAIARGDSLKTPYLKQHISRGIAGTLGILAFFFGHCRDLKLHFTDFLGIVVVCALERTHQPPHGGDFVVGLCGCDDIAAPEHRR